MSFLLQIKGSKHTDLIKITSADSVIVQISCWQSDFDGTFLLLSYRYFENFQQSSINFLFPNDFLMNLIPFFVPSSQVSFLTDQMLSWQIVTVLLSLSVDEFHRVVLLPILFLLIIDDLLNLASYLLICCYTIHCSVSPDKCMIGITQFLRSCCRMSKFSFCYF